jgi:3-oxoacyl-[acyl-carrier-protein] synthase III
MLLLADAAAAVVAATTLLSQMLLLLLRLINQSSEFPSLFSSGPCVKKLTLISGFHIQTHFETVSMCGQNVK